MPTRQLDTHHRSPASAPDEPAESGYDLRTRVTLSRTHEKDVRQRQVIARIDDGPPQTLMYGEATTQEVRPGTHRLRANNTLFWKSATFNVEPGEHIEFVLINHAGPFTLSLLALLGAAPLFLKIERRSLN